MFLSNKKLALSLFFVFAKFAAASSILFAFAASLGIRGE